MLPGETGNGHLNEDFLGNWCVIKQKAELVDVVEGDWHHQGRPL